MSHSPRLDEMAIFFVVHIYIGFDRLNFVLYKPGIYLWQKKDFKKNYISNVEALALVINLSSLIND